MSLVVNCCPSLDNHVQTWAYNDRTIHLYNLTDGLICLSRAAACFKALSDGVAQDQNYQKAGYEFWDAGVKILSYTKKDVRTFVHKRLYEMHGANSLICDYGKRSFHQDTHLDVRPSTSLERSIAIQEALATLFPSYANLFAMDGFSDINRAALCWYHASCYPEDSKEHINEVNDAKRFWGSGTTDLKQIGYNYFEGDVHEQLWIMHSRIDYLEYGRHAFEHTHSLSSSPISKYGAITCAMRNFSPERFCLVESTSESYIPIASAPGLTFTEELAFWLSESLQIGYSLYNQPSPFFVAHWEKCPNWPSQLKFDSGFSYQITLFKHQQHNWWQWRLFQSATKIVYWLDATEVIPQHFPKGTLPSWGDCDNYLKDYDLTIVRDSSANPSSITFSLKTFPSKLDRRYTLNRDQVSVTLISNGHSSGQNTCYDDGHAEIWIEGAEKWTIPCRAYPFDCTKQRVLGFRKKRFYFFFL